MRLSFDDTLFIRQAEGCRLHAYPDPVSGGSPWTIGYGCTGPTIHKGLVWTQSQCDDEFMTRMDAMCDSIDEVITVPLTTNQMVALCSLVWNIGITNFKSSTLLKKLNSNEDISQDFLSWDHSCGHVIPALLARRKRESALFLTP